MMKAFRQNKKGASTVLGAVIMTLIVVVGLSLMFGYVISYSSDFQSGRGSAIMETLVVENYHFVDQDTIKLWISNVGKISFEIQAVYIDGLRADNFVSTPETFDVEGYTGSFGYITIDSRSPFVLDNGFPYTIRLVTERGAIFEENFYYGEIN